MNTKNTKRYRIRVAGNVQRVGFRHVASAIAIRNNLTGIACYVNRDILIEVEGLAHDLENFLAWTRTGPEGCIIENYELFEIPPVKSKLFEIVPGITADSELQQMAV